MPSTTPSGSDTKRGEDCPRLNIYNNPKADTTGNSKTPSIALSALTNGSAGEPRFGAPPSEAMERWLGQVPKDEPWYHGGRLAGDTSKDGKAEIDK
ncbi:hypothetical protein MMC13_001828 [Lambiella insularis]|nr:hypothetical protein [Lambiella insularis]